MFNSRSCFLALIAVLLFVTLAALFESLPPEPYHGAGAVTDSSSEWLNGAVDQLPPLGPAPPFIVIDDPEPEEIEEPLTPEEQEIIALQAAEKKLAEEMKRKEDERRKKEKAEAEQRKKKGPSKFKKIDTFNADDVVYDPAGPRPDQIILLSASDGKGHNGGIPHLLEDTQVNRKEYAQLHGYTYHFLNISKYEYGGAHPVWAKLPAIVETFNTFPDAQWIWWLDLDAIIMTPTIELSKFLLSHEALNNSIMRGVELKKGGGASTGVFTSKNPNVKKVDLIFSQDLNGINAGSFFIRRSEFTRWFMDMWADPFFMGQSWPGQEQDAVGHLIREHPIMREHLAIVPQLMINAYPIDTPGMGWRKGDLIVHLAGCWVEEVCDVRWRQYQRKKMTVAGGAPPSPDWQEPEGSEDSEDPEESDSDATPKQPEESDSKEKSKQPENSVSKEKSKQPENSGSKEKSKQSENSESKEKSKKPENSESKEKSKQLENSDSKDKSKPTQNPDSKEKSKQPENSDSKEKSKQPENSDSKDKLKQPENSDSKEKSKPTENSDSNAKLKPIENLDSNAKS
ncbi:hypothetical protein RUND412_008785 [Rhizina undulata]